MNKLYNFGMNKKAMLQEERKRIMEDGFVEREMKYFTKIIHNLMQAEMDRHLAFSHLIRGYYRGVEQKPVEEFPGQQLCAINYDVVTASFRIFLK